MGDLRDQKIIDEMTTDQLMKKHKV
jgi:hypothetical protein